MSHVVDWKAIADRFDEAAREAERAAAKEAERLRHVEAMADRLTATALAELPGKLSVALSAGAPDVGLLGWTSNMQADSVAAHERAVQLLGAALQLPTRTQTTGGVTSQEKFTLVVAVEELRSAVAARAAQAEQVNDSSDVTTPIDRLLQDYDRSKIRHL